MANSDSGGADSEHLPADAKQEPPENRIQMFQSAAGVLFVMMAVFSFGATIYQVVRIGPNYIDERDADLIQSSFDKVFLENTPAFILLASSIVGAFLGIGLLRSALKARAKTIPEEDRRLLEPLISDAKNEAVNQYVRISSLTGSTGFFTKLGFTGLPLVTASLGLILIFLSMMSEKLSDDLIDLAKLVIGAFIGSFVQRKADQTRASGDTVRPEDTLM